MESAPQWLRSRPFTASLAAVGVAMMVSPLSTTLPVGTGIYYLALLAAVFGATDSKVLRRVTLLYTVAGLVAHFGNAAAGGPVSDTVFFVADCAFAAFTPALVIRHVLAQQDTQIDELAGALVSYMLIGVFFGFAHALVEHLAPGSYGGMPELAGVGQRENFTYFSFVTLTTLGYGDMAPVSPVAQNMSVLEAALGQTYIAVLIAHLVGRRSSAGVAEGPAHHAPAADNRPPG